MLIKLIRRLAKNRRGGTAIEYGLIAALVVITMIAAFMQVADSTVGLWSNVNTKMAVARSGG
jgi:pilus assembly protein Flp/PilA